MSTPVFIDAVHAAEMLRISQDAVLDLVTEGKLRTYGGKASNPFLRSAEVVALVGELAPAEDEVQPRRVKSASARVRQRLTADSRWSEITEDDMRDWASRSDPTARQAARKAAVTARERLQILLQILDEQS
jgi:hypothetical protein